MGRYKEKPRYKVVSLRVSDEEWDELMVVCHKTSKTVSEFLRDALTSMECRVLNGNDLQPL
jgi:hypothetical protein